MAHSGRGSVIKLAGHPTQIASPQQVSFSGHKSERIIPPRRHARKEPCKVAKHPSAQRPQTQPSAGGMREPRPNHMRQKSDVASAAECLILCLPAVCSGTACHFRQRQGAKPLAQWPREGTPLIDFKGTNGRGEFRSPGLLEPHYGTQSRIARESTRDQGDILIPSEPVLH